jgi:hypothetical protein
MASGDFELLSWRADEKISNGLFFAFFACNPILVISAGLEFNLQVLFL